MNYPGYGKRWALHFWLRLSAWLALICKVAKKNLGKKVLAVIGAAAFVGAILAVILIARTPMPL